MLAVVAPGQGAQRRGMLEAWRRSPGAAATLAQASAIMGMDLLEADSVDALGVQAAQELIVSLGCAAWGELAAGHAARTPGAAASSPRLSPVLLAGHSVGELTAAYAGGALGLAATLRTTRARAAAMAACSEAHPGGMAALSITGRGLSATDVDAVRDEATRQALDHGVVVAVVNSPDQLVVAGAREALAELAGSLTAAPLGRVRLTPLRVAGAFHTPSMADAAGPLAEALTDARTDDASADAGPPEGGGAFVRGLDGQLTDAAGLLDALAEQLTSAVRWDLVVDRLVSCGVTGVLELPPAGTLTALIRRAAPRLDTFALTSPDELASAAVFIDCHLAGAPR